MAKKVNITVDEELLELVDEYADANFTSRSGVFTQAAAALVNTARLTAAVNDMALSLRRIADAGKVEPAELAQIEQVASVLTASMSVMKK